MAADEPKAQPGSSPSFPSERIIRRLKEVGAEKPCPRCGHEHFQLVEGYFAHGVQMQLDGSLVLGGPVVPTIGVVCRRCGYLSEHALGVLGLLPEKKS